MDTTVVFSSDSKTLAGTFIYNDNSYSFVTGIITINKSNKADVSRLIKENLEAGTNPASLITYLKSVDESALRYLL